MELTKPILITGASGKTGQRAVAAIARKGGIVRDPALHAEVCERIERWLGCIMGWRVLGVTDSPIAGQDGNKEFLIAAMRNRGQGSND